METGYLCHAKVRVKSISVLSWRKCWGGRVPPLPIHPRFVTTDFRW